MSALALVPAAVSAQQASAPVSPWNTIVVAQVERCWTPPVSIQGGKGVRVSLEVLVSRNGVPQAIQVVDQQRYSSDSFFRAASDGAVRAFRNPLCQPLRLPADRFAEWQHLFITLDTQDLL